MLRSLFFLCGLVSCLCGCQMKTDTFKTADTPSSLSAPAASAIAGDLSARFAEQAGSLPQPISLQGDGTPFSTSLSAALKGWGYTIGTDDRKPTEKDSPASVELRYALTSLDGQVLARLSTDTITVSRIYNVTATSATPASPLSMMKRN